MLTNTVCTLYAYDGDSGGYTRTVIENVYWSSVHKRTVGKSGANSSDETVVYFYGADFPKTASKDILVKGVCEFEFDNSTQESISRSFAEFRKITTFVTVMSISDCRFGGLSHMEVTAK